MPKTAPASDTPNPHCVYRKQLEFLKAVLAVQICLLQILLIFAKLVLILG